MTAQPTAEFQAHHEIEAPRVDDRAFRQGWRVRTRLDRLLADGRITAGQWQAMVEYRDAWATTTRLAGSSLGRMGVSGRFDVHATALARLATVTRLSEAEASIGELAARLCYACAVEDVPWVTLGRRLKRNAETARDWTVVAIRGLALVWGRKNTHADPGNLAPGGVAAPGRHNRTPEGLEAPGGASLGRGADVA